MLRTRSANYFGCFECEVAVVWLGLVLSDFTLVKEVLFVLGVTSPCLVALLHFLVCISFSFVVLCLNLFRILLLSVYFLSYPPPRGQDSDTTAAVDEVGNTWLTKTVE